MLRIESDKPLSVFFDYTNLNAELLNSKFGDAKIECGVDECNMYISLFIPDELFKSIGCC